MRGGRERWKRGVESHGARQAISYAFEGTCDAHRPHPTGAEPIEAYGAASDSTVSRFIAENGVITSDELTAGGLRVWLTGHDPITGEERGKQRLSPDADLLLDGTLNHPKSYSIAALLHPELAAEFEALQGRLRDRIPPTTSGTACSRTSKWSRSSPSCMRLRTGENSTAVDRAPVRCFHRTIPGLRYGTGRECGIPRCVRGGLWFDESQRGAKLTRDRRPN